MKKQNEMSVEFEKIDEAEKEKYVKKFPERLPDLKIVCFSNLKAWDWRKLKKVTPVRNQLSCGSCWAFATLGAYEGSYAIRNDIRIDSSEQCVLNCSGAGSCAGGWWAFNFLMVKGTAKEGAYPYNAHDQACLSTIPTPYKAVTWGYVATGSTVPSVRQLKEALCKYGPLAVAVRVTPAFQAYVGGVFNENNTGSVNHGVTLIGWDDAKGAWLIKNSWGTGWGSTGGYGTEKGYMWIAYGSNKIGYAAAWVKARRIFYPLPKIYYELIRRRIPIKGISVDLEEEHINESN
jgi:cathepsin L